MINSNDGNHVTPLFYPIKRVCPINIRQPTQKGKVVLNVDCGCNVNCYGEDGGTATACDGINSMETCQRDCILGFWKDVSSDIYNQVLKVNHVVFDLLSVINQLVVADKDEQVTKKFGIVIPISPTNEVLHGKHNKKGFEFSEIAQRDLAKNGSLFAIDYPIVRYCFDDIDIIGSMNDENKLPCDFRC